PATGSREQGPGTIEHGRNSEAHSTLVALIGAGRVATAFGILLERSGHPVPVATGRGATRERVGRYLPRTRFVPFNQASPQVTRAEIVLIGLPDEALADGCRTFAEHGAFRHGQAVVHLSGSLGL